MAKYGIARHRTGGETLPRANPPAHDAWPRDHHTGLLELRLETLPGRFVSPGTGRLRLLDTGDEARSNGELLVQAAARRAGQPVIPGSGIKGAVRTLYEILSDSCDPHTRGPCQANLRQKRFADRKYCAVCSLFGCMGWHGRVSFSDASPADSDSVHAGAYWVPTPWEPNAAETRGDFRLYDLRQATVEDKVAGSSSPAEKPLAREGYEGVFIGRLNFWNLSAQELGRLMIAMGLAASKAETFPIRLGGCKYDGQGAVTVHPAATRLVSPRREELHGQELRKCWQGWIAQAKAAPWYEQYQSKLDELGRILRLHQSGA